MMLGSLLDTWTSFYSNHATLKTAIEFVHIGGLMLGGGCAITADLATIQAAREGSIGRRSQFHVLKRTHTIVVVGLAALFVSGLLLFAADADTFLHSRVFWLKMVLFALLLANGVAMLAGEHRVRRGDVRAWRYLHTIAVSSLVLWFVTTLAGFGLGTSDAVALPIGTTSGEQNGSDRRYPVPTSDSVNIDHGAGLIVARYQNRVMVFSLACPHENNAVKWVAKDHRFQCTKHDSTYSPDGIHTDGRATRNMDRYVIRRDGNSIVVDLHKWVQSDKDQAGWTAAQIVV